MEKLRKPPQPAFMDEEGDIYTVRRRQSGLYRAERLDSGTETGWSAVTENGERAALRLHVSEAMDDLWTYAIRHGLRATEYQE